MPTPQPDDMTVALTADGTLRISDLELVGASAEWAARTAARGGDVREAVEEALDLGSRVLLHGSSLGTVDAVATEVDRLLEALDAKVSRLDYVTRATARTSTKGLRYEQDLGPVLDSCFAAHQDVVEDLTATPGLGDVKTGDFLVTLNPRDTAGSRRRIVFEAKNQKLSMTAALAELAAAMLNRGADVGVLVFADQRQAPLQGKPLRTLPGNRVIAVWKPDDSSLTLEVASQIARTLAQSAVEERTGKLNRRAVAGRLDRVVNIVESAQDIQRGIDSASVGIEKARNAYELMRDQALAELYEIQDRL